MDGTPTNHALHDFHLDGLFAFSFGVEALIVADLSKLPPSADGTTIAFTEAQLSEMVLMAFSRVHDPKDVKKVLPALTSKVTARLRRSASVAQHGQASRSSGSDFGKDFRDWASSLSPEGCCLYVAGFDPVKAGDLYWRCDREIVEAAVRAKIEFDWVRAGVSFDACVYGFGGSRGESAGNVNEFDLTNGEGLDALRKLGF